MELVADILLVAGAIGAGLYCFVLARRLNRFNDLEKGVGGAVAVLSSQVDDLNRTLTAAKSASDGSNAALDALTGRAEAVAGRLELLMASMHDLPDRDATGPQTNSEDTEPLHEPGKLPMFMRHGESRKGITGAPPDRAHAASERPAAARSS